MLLLLLFFSGYQLHVGHSQGLRPFISTVQNADCRPLFSVLESNGTIVFSPSFAWWKQWSAAVSSLHFIRTVLATNLSGSIFCPQWLSPLHCHGGCESILFSCSFQTGTLLLNLISCRLHFNYSAFFPPKRSRRWIFGKGEVNNGSTLIQPLLGSSSFRSTFIAAQNTWPISALNSAVKLRGMARTLRMRKTTSPGYGSPY